MDESISEITMYHEALASSFLRGLMRKIKHRAHLATGGGTYGIPWRSRGNLSLGQTVTQIALVASQFPDANILVDDLSGFGTKRQGTLFGQDDCNELDAQVLD